MAKSKKLSAKMTHLAVLPAEVIAGLALQPGMTIVDCTLGGGGHSAAIAQCIGEQGRIIALDQDPLVCEYAKTVLTQYPQIELAQQNFCHLPKVLAEKKISAVDGILLDLGVSSFQIDDPQRGFSWQKDCPLDMRMNRQNQLTAAELLNNTPESELADIIYKYGEERYSRRIARSICLAREKNKLTASGQLRDIVWRAAQGNYAAKTASLARVFQALRIAVNDELNILEKNLSNIISFLKPGGRIAVISFHSLEDRIVKNIFRELQKQNILTLVNKKPITAEAQELKNNPRARSAKLRVGEKNV